MKQAVPDAQARLPGQGAATGVPQVPLPLHSVSLVSIEVATAHETTAEQVVPEGQSRQAPVPEAHIPLVPQVAEPVAGHEPEQQKPPRQLPTPLH